MTVLGANRKEQTIYNMKEVIQAGICTIDKHPLPEGVSPQHVRASIAERDTVLKQDGTRIICRMAKNPMGLIYAGDVARAQHEVDTILLFALRLEDRVNFIYLVKQYHFLRYSQTKGN